MIFQTSFFDVPLHHKLHLASQAGAGYDLRRILDNTIVQERPGDAVTFVDNHE
jgi:alpha-amylase